ncbi:MAG: protein phosphatase 2C domain-containing protein [Ginsengibacter sp.]
MAEYFYGITDKGKRREKNEDTFFARETADKRFIVAGVIDGVGGYTGGDVAAGIARSVIMKNLRNISEDIIESLTDAIVAANVEINEKKKEEPSNDQMSCVLTCVVADVKNNKCWYAHVGDTRIYLFRDHSLVKISRDHSVVGFLEESGRLSEEEAMRHPRRNEINKALGFEEDISVMEDFIQTGESPFLPGDALLLCSDGLTDMISSGTITKLLTSKKNPAAKAKALIDAANDAGGNDNITAVLIENNNWPKQKREPVNVEKRKREIIAPAANSESALTSDTKPAKKMGSRLVAFIIILLIGLAAVSLTVAFNKNKKPVVINNIPLQMPKQKDEQLIQLISHVNDLSKKFVLSQQQKISDISEPLIVAKDSFYLAGNGAVFTADSLYKGAAFIINPTAKHIVLDSLVFQNFDVGIIVQKNNITFSNVRFINCRIPVQYILSLPDSIISGRFKDSIFITQTKFK